MLWVLSLPSIFGVEDHANKSPQISRKSGDEGQEKAKSILEMVEEARISVGCFLFVVVVGSCW